MISIPLCISHSFQTTVPCYKALINKQDLGHDLNFILWRKATVLIPFTDIYILANLHEDNLNSREFWVANSIVLVYRQLRTINCWDLQEPEKYSEWEDDNIVFLLYYVVQFSYWFLCISHLMDGGAKVAFHITVKS